MLYAKFIANGDILSMDQEKFNFLNVFITIDNRMNTTRFIQKLNIEIERQLRNENDVLQKVKDVWSFVKRLEVGGVKLNPAEIQDIVDNAIYSLVDTIKIICDDKTKKDGIVIFIDEADNSPEELQIGSFLKILNEKLISENCENVLFVMAGLPEVRNKLRESHQSSLRIFEELELATLSKQDTRAVIESGLTEVKNEQKVLIEIADAAVDTIYLISEGYPHFIQQLAYCAFEQNSDHIIDGHDVNESISNSLRLIGDRYYKDMFFNKILSESYRDVLVIMSEKGSDWITKEEIKKKFRGSEKTLNNAISALKTRNIILVKEGVKGYYRLQWIAFALWIKYFTQKDLSTEADKA